MKLELTFNPQNTAGTFVVLQEGAAPTPVPPVVAPVPKPVVIPPGVRVVKPNVSSENSVGQTTWKAGQIVAIGPYRSGAVPKAGYFKLYSYSGSGIGMSATIALSKAIGDMSTAQERSTNDQYPQFNFGATYFVVEPNTNYYVNIRANAAGSHNQLNFKLVQNGAL